MRELRKYEPPQIVDLGSIAEHTYAVSLGRGRRTGNPHPGYKGGGIIAHCDKFAEWSGGSGPELADCSDVTNPGAE